MTRLVQDDGRVIPFTVVECEPNEVVQLKTTEKDGYPAVVLGFSKLHKPNKNKKFYFVREFRVDPTSAPKKGDLITVEMFQENEVVKVTGVSKGKGFQGVVKKYHFKGGSMTHGSHNHREPGSIGGGLRNKVPKGMRMAGRMGGDQISVTGLSIVDIDKEKNILYIKGALPGARNSLVIISAPGEMNIQESQENNKTKKPENIEEQKPVVEVVEEVKLEENK